MESLRPSISVVVPVYRSEALLRPFVERLQPMLAAHASDSELILVDDSSPDGSWEVVRDLAATRPWIRGIRLMRNYGQHGALLCGIRAARHELVVTMDDDLQHPPEELPKLLVALDDGFDVVYGTPEHQQHGFARDLASQIAKLVLQGAMGAETARKVSAFRIFRTELREAFQAYRGQFVSIDVLLTWGTTRFRAVPVRHDPRAEGASNYTWRKLLTHALNMMTGFSAFPLQIASLVGFAFTLFGIGVLVFVLGRYLLYQSPVQGFTFLASAVAIFSGAQLFALGIIGEYLARVHFRVMDRPPYVVRSRAGTER
jgi:undecaprenyl-phosphate 4-deoxy-4-formamido-L-arabinose transferase